MVEDYISQVPLLSGLQLLQPIGGDWNRRRNLEFFSSLCFMRCFLCGCSPPLGVLSSWVALVVILLMSSGFNFWQHTFFDSPGPGCQQRVPRCYSAQRAHSPIRGLSSYLYVKLPVFKRPSVIFFSSFKKHCLLVCSSFYLFWPIRWGDITSWAQRMP